MADRNVTATAAAIEDAANLIESALIKLGLADASTSLGAIELLAKEHRDGARNVSAAIREAGGEIGAGLRCIADELRELRMELRTVGR